MRVTFGPENTDVPTNAGKEALGHARHVGNDEIVAILDPFTRLD
jgi:hypothetical protein